MARLRRECPWDAQQTHESLAPYLLEESYEALEALESGDPDAAARGTRRRPAAGVFHAEVAAERTDGTGYTIDDVADGIAAKLIRRHPHVFSDVSVSGADEVKRNWDAIKAAERGGQVGRGPARRWTACRSGSPRCRWRPSCSAGRSGPGSRPNWPTCRPSAGRAAGLTVTAGAGRVLIGAALFAVVAQARAAGLDPSWNCGPPRSYRDGSAAGPGEPGLEPELDCAPRGPRLTGTGVLARRAERLRSAPRPAWPLRGPAARSTRLQCGHVSPAIVRESCLGLHRSHSRQADPGLARQPDRRGRGRARRRHAGPRGGAQRRLDRRVRGRRAQGRRRRIRRQGRSARPSRP